MNRTFAALAIASILLLIASGFNIITRTQKKTLSDPHEKVVYSIKHARKEGSPELPLKALAEPKRPASIPKPKVKNAKGLRDFLHVTDVIPLPGGLVETPIRVEWQSHFKLISEKETGGKSIVLDQNGNFLYEIEKLNSADYTLKLFDRFLLAYSYNSFDLYGLESDCVVLIRTYDIKNVYYDLISQSPIAEKEADLFFSDFFFKVENEELIIWAFNAYGKFFPLKRPHLLLNGPLGGTGPLVCTSHFGLSTIADRLPGIARKTEIMVDDGYFWVPRKNDPQIDVFDNRGQLHQSVEVQFDESTFSTKPYTSKSYLEAAFSVNKANLERTTNEMKNTPYVYNVWPLGQFRAVQKLNRAGELFISKCDIIDAGGRVVVEDIKMSNLEFVGTNKDSSVILFDTRNPFPDYLTEADSLIKLKSHNGLSLITVTCVSE
jgi:hypothetical protein